MKEKCLDFGLEYAFPKPFCSLEPSEDKPTISRFIDEMKVGRPSLKIAIEKMGKQEIIASAIVRRSAPCSSTWYIAKKLVGVKVKKKFFTMQ